MPPCLLMSPAGYRYPLLAGMTLVQASSVMCSLQYFVSLIYFYKFISDSVLLYMTSKLNGLNAVQYFIEL